MPVLVNHSCSEYTGRFWFSCTDLAISLTIHKSFFVEFDCSLIAPLTCVVFSDLSADLGSKLLLHGDGVRLLQLHPLQHLGLHIPCLDTAKTQQQYPRPYHLKWENIEIQSSFLLLCVCLCRQAAKFCLEIIMQNIWCKMWNDDKVRQREQHNWNWNLLFVGRVKLPHFCQPYFGSLPTGPDNGSHLRAPAVHSLGEPKEKSGGRNKTKQ